MKPSSRGGGSSIPAKRDDWDDSVIIRAFEDAVNSHRTKSSDGKEIPPAPIESAGSGATTSKRQHGTMGSEEPDLSSQQRRIKSRVEHGGAGAMKEGMPNQDIDCGASLQLGDSAASRVNASADDYDAGAFVPSGIEIEASELARLDQQALNQMLMMWYQSGYATGRYHAIQEFKEMQLNRCNQRDEAIGKPAPTEQEDA